MSENEVQKRVDQYRICQTRGHEPSNIRLACNPPLDVCKHCGAHFRYESTLIERHIPEELH